MPVSQLLSPFASIAKTALASTNRRRVLDSASVSDVYSHELSADLHRSGCFGLRYGEEPEAALASHKSQCNDSDLSRTHEVVGAGFYGGGCT